MGGRRGVAGAATPGGTPHCRQSEGSGRGDAMCRIRIGPCAGADWPGGHRLGARRAHSTPCDPDRRQATQRRGHYRTHASAASDPPPAARVAALMAASRGHSREAVNRVPIRTPAGPGSGQRQAPIGVKIRRVRDAIVRPSRRPRACHGDQSRHTCLISWLPSTPIPVTGTGMTGRRGRRLTAIGLS